MLKVWGRGKGIGKRSVGADILNFFPDLIFLSDLTKLGWLEPYKEILIVWAVAHGIEKRK